MIARYCRSHFGSPPSLSSALSSSCFQASLPAVLIQDAFLKSSFAISVGCERFTSQSTVSSSPFLRSTLCSLEVTISYKRNNWPLLDVDTLMERVNKNDLQTGALKLQSFADGANGTRVFGRPGQSIYTFLLCRWLMHRLVVPGHIATVDWLYDTLSSLDAYNVTKQTLIAYGYTLINNATVTISSGEVETSTPDFSPAGTAEGTVVAAGLGCEPVSALVLQQIWLCNKLI